MGSRLNEKKFSGELLFLRVDSESEKHVLDASIRNSPCSPCLRGEKGVLKWYMARRMEDDI